MTELQQVSGVADLHLLGEAATPPSARAERRLAALQLVAIVRYYASSRLARHRAAPTLVGVQLPILGRKGVAHWNAR